MRLGEQIDILAGLSPEELDMRIDLRPFMQRTPFIIQVTLLSLASMSTSLQAEVRILGPVSLLSVTDLFRRL